MNLIKYFLLASFLITCFTFCHREFNKEQRKIFDLKGFLDSQVKLLSYDKVKLKKTTTLGGQLEKIFITPDSSSWAKELSIFKTADINKPGLQKFYDKKISKIGDTEKEEYILLDSNQSETVYLGINKDSKSGIIRSIEAIQHINNPIYQSRREMFLVFESEDQTIRLDSFAILGYQKMTLQDSVNYFTLGKIITN